MKKRFKKPYYKCSNCGAIRTDYQEGWNPYCIECEENREMEVIK